MRNRIRNDLTREVTDSEALRPVRRDAFLVYLMGPYRTFDVDALLPADADIEADAPSFATWNDATGEYAEDEVLGLLQATRDCLRDRGLNAFLAIDVGIELDEMDAATRSIAFAQASNATILSLHKSVIISVSVSRSEVCLRICCRPMGWTVQPEMQHHLNEASG